MVDRVDKETTVPQSETLLLLNKRIREIDSHLCVGIDIESSENILASPTQILKKNIDLVDQTENVAAAYKFQLSGYLGLGGQGIEILNHSIYYIKTTYPHIPVILDGKFNDIGESLEHYAHFAFNYLEVDSVTANPYLGMEANAPLIKRNSKLIYFLCSTSNPGSKEFQHQVMFNVAQNVQRANSNGNLGLVVGATHPEVIGYIRKTAPNLPFLMPGLGAQGAAATSFIPPALTDMPASVLVNVSRGITKADNPKKASFQYAQEIRDAKKLGYTEHSKTKHLITLLEKANAIQYGDFTLVSGEKTTIYINIRHLSHRPDILMEISRSLAELTETLDYDIIATIPQAGIPLGTCLSFITNKPMVWIRDKPKGYGTNSQIEGGADVYDKKILLVDDVVTHATSKIKALDALKNAGAKVSDLAVVVDRRDEKSIELQGITIHSLLTLDQILSR